MASNFNMQAALSAGYTPEQIHAFVASQPDLQLQGIEQPQAPTGPALSYMKALSAGYTRDVIEKYAQEQGLQLDQSGMKQDTILPDQTPITETFGQYQPQNEVFSNGVTNGTGLGAPVGTKVAVPPGTWKVVDSYNQASAPGYIGDGTNKGYGNSALVENTQTGERLRFSHLMHNFTQPGQQIDGNTVIGETGATGNVTGPHLNLEYYDGNGKLGDVLQSKYRSYIPIQGQ